VRIYVQESDSAKQKRLDKEKKEKEDARRKVEINLIKRRQLQESSATLQARDETMKAVSKKTKQISKIVAELSKKVSAKTKKKVTNTATGGVTKRAAIQKKTVATKKVTPNTVVGITVEKQGEKRKDMLEIELSDAAKRAKPGHRAGIQQRSDKFACAHWGIQDMYNNGGVAPAYMNYHLKEQGFLYRNKCKGCAIPAESLDKSKCNIIDKV
jgi:hypothetical protein